MALTDSISRVAGTFERREWLRRTAIWATHVIIFCVSPLFAYLLRFDFNIPPAELVKLWFAIPVWVLTKSVIVRWFDLDRGWWMFVSTDDVIRIALANLLGSAISFLVIRRFGPAGFPRSAYLLDFGICFLGTAGVRILVRILIEKYCQVSTADEKKTLIYGAGSAGIALLREIRANQKLQYSVCGFIDDDPRKTGLVIQGKEVIGRGEHLARIVVKQSVEVVLIAVAAASGAEMTRILRLCQDARVTSKIIPGLAELIDGRGLARQIRDVSVEDLLGRNPIRLEETQIRNAIQDKVILVTGAAGSIGSELCRQIARFHPAAIVGFEIAESALFDIDREMKQTFPNVPFYPEIGSIQNRVRLEEVVGIYRPSVVYHAAAYKHVPLMESHAFEAVENNVFGTYNVATVSAEHGVEHFVLISTDKAVRPTSIMGATKRLAELLVVALQGSRTKCVAVRFGNVLGSNGSVVPIFKRQIASGGPITVTHPDMRRFFMTIPEACQLVLQAAAIGRGGHIYVLDMGEPVRVLELAENLILLSGLKPDEDIKIEFIGMRPGEKLCEELSSMLEETVPTTHEKIRIFVDNGANQRDVITCLEDLGEICKKRDIGRLILTLKRMVLDYSPSTELLSRILQQNVVAHPSQEQKKRVQTSL